MFFSLECAYVSLFLYIQGDYVVCTACLSCKQWLVVVSEHVIH